jgi:hypothetical protein
MVTRKISIMIHQKKITTLSHFKDSPHKKIENAIEIGDSKGKRKY